MILLLGLTLFGVYGHSNGAPVFCEIGAPCKEPTLRYTTPTDGVTHELNRSQVSTIPNSKLILLVHGYIETSEKPHYIALTNAYITKKGVNVLAFDWRSWAAGLYSSAIQNAVDAGELLGKIICELSANGFDLNNLHVVSHSLGCHVAGYAGLYVKTNNCGIVRRITGLDPAGPGFHLIKRPLNKSDAKSVVILNTSRLFGLYKQTGTVTFNANENSLDQPGCLFSFLYDNSSEILKHYIFCSHHRSVTYKTESLGGGKEFVGRDDNGTQLVFNEGIPDDASGTYNFNTDPNGPPFALG